MSKQKNHQTYGKSLKPSEKKGGREGGERKKGEREREDRKKREREGI